MEFLQGFRPAKIFEWLFLFSMVAVPILYLNISAFREYSLFVDPILYIYFIGMAFFQIVSSKHFPTLTTFEIACLLSVAYVLLRTGVSGSVQIVSFAKAFGL